MSETTQSVYYPICVMANAQNIETAYHASQQWPHFPFWFSVWGDESVVEYQRVGERVFLVPAPNTTHAEGWEFALKHAKQEPSFECKYFFTLDDDLVWSISESGMKELETMESGISELIEVKTRLLVSFLDEYQPAIAVFPWPWGDEVLSNLTDVNSRFAGELLQPATSFDNGCLIFSNTVVDFFIPLWLGGAHNPRFINQHSLLNLFIPYMFKEHAIRYNGVQYENPPLVRHPYDDPGPFNTFLLEGFRCDLWGSQLSSKDVAQVKKGNGKYVFDDLEVLGSFFKLDHPIIRDHPKLLERFSKDTMLTKAKETQKRPPLCSVQSATQTQPRNVT